MPQAQIYLGSSELLHTFTTDVEVHTAADYVPAYARIVRALHEGAAITVAVSARHVGVWLRRLAERYGTTRVRVVELTWRARLRDQWQIAVPAWVTEEQIARAGLLDVAITPTPGRDFADFVLEVFFSPFLAQPRLPLNRLGDLLQSYAPAQWAAARARPVVGDIFRRRLQKWASAAEHAGEKLLVRWLQETPEQLAAHLAVLKALSDYPPEVGQRVLGAAFPALAQLDLDLSAIPMDETQIGAAVDQIRVYLKQVADTHAAPEAVQIVLAQASGGLEIEFDLVQRLLRSGDVAVDHDLVRRVRGLFAPLRHRPHLEQALADLDLLISRPAPPPPDPDPEHPWSAAQWLEWATQHYLPYRFWLEEVGQLTGAVADFAAAYAEWLYAHYPALRLSAPQMIYQALPALKARLQDAAPVLVLLIDNFNAKFYPDFQRYMRQEGYYSEETSYYLSMLPSCTAVSKKCLFVGQPEPFTGTAYQKPVQETWTQALSGRRVLYLAHVGELRAVQSREHDVYFLNYLALDKVLHQDEEHFGLSHAQSARSYLRAIARDVRAFGERIGAARDLGVIVLSDHGSTRIPADAPNLIDPQFFAGRVQDKHHRYVTISDRELQQLPRNIQYQCYVFARERFGLPQNYLVAKAHYRFLPTTRSTYIHGGLTPEETLVPVAVFTPITVAPKPLFGRLLRNEFYYGRKTELSLELVNANNYACEQVQVAVLNPNVDALGAELATLAPLSQGVVNLTGRFKAAQGEITALHLRVTYDFLGHRQHQELTCAVVMKKVMEHAFDLDDLF